MPGYCGAQDTFYVGTLKGVGRVYQQTFIDTYAKVAFAKLYDRKTPITAAEILNDRVVPFYDEHGIRLSRMLNSAAARATNTSSISRSTTSTTAAPKPRARRPMASASASTAPSWTSSTGLRSARRSTRQKLIPDNTKTGLTDANYWDPVLNRSYHALGRHYNVAIVPARVRKPRDKPSGENAVRLVEMWVLEPLRQRQFDADVVVDVDARHEPLADDEGRRRQRLALVALDRLEQRASAALARRRKKGGCSIPRSSRRGRHWPST
jgi:hypothetical protein